MIKKEVLAAVEQAAAVTFNSGYHISELQGGAYYTALRTAQTHLIEDAGQEFNHVNELIRFIEQSDLEFSETGEIVGGWIA